MRNNFNIKRRLGYQFTLYSLILFIKCYTMDQLLLVCKLLCFPCVRWAVVNVRLTGVEFTKFCLTGQCLYAAWCGPAQWQHIGLCLGLGHNSTVCDSPQRTHLNPCLQFAAICQNPYNKNQLIYDGMIVFWIFS